MLLHDRATRTWPATTTRGRKIFSHGSRSSTSSRVYLPAHSARGAVSQSESHGREVESHGGVGGGGLIGSFSFNLWPWPCICSVALVTGGGSGIGFEVARQLGLHGAKVGHRT